VVLAVLELPGKDFQELLVALEMGLVVAAVVLVVLEAIMEIDRNQVMVVLEWIIRNLQHHFVEFLEFQAGFLEVVGVLRMMLAQQVQVLLEKEVVEAAEVAPLAVQSHQMVDYLVNLEL
jgi:hypothetical protein